MNLSSALIEQLSTSRFLINGATPSVGVGERRSKAKGAGLEFADHRPYNQGDDVRHLDSRLLARLGENFIRQYSVDRQLPITILVDASTSMRYGTPDKFEVVQALVQGLAYIGLAGGDRVQLVAFSDGKLQWSPRVQGANRAEILFGWLAEQSPRGAGSFRTALRDIRSEIRPAGLLLIISDWWVDDFGHELAALRADRQEIVAFHIAAPEEADPARLGNGPHYMVDAETGEEIELHLSGATIEKYRAAYAERAGALKASFSRHLSRYIPMTSDIDLQALFLRRLRSIGVIS